jgi:hypothetical protein
MSAHVLDLSEGDLEREEQGKGETAPSSPESSDASASQIDENDETESSDASASQIDEIDENEDPKQKKLKWSCQLIRAKMGLFLASKEMTQKDFLKAIGCNSSSYSRFIRLKGLWNGLQNGVYWGAYRFFMARENIEKEEKKKEKALPVADRKRKAEADADEATQKKKAKENLLAAVNRVRLDSHDYVYDDCDEVRKKSLEFMAAHDVTQVEFLKAIGGISKKAWTTFSGYRGAGAGAAKQSYVGAYRFLERYRILKEMPKTAKRKKTEKEMPTGYNLIHDDGKRWYLVATR